MISARERIIKAAESELKRLRRIAANAQEKLDQQHQAISELIDIRKKQAEIINSETDIHSKASQLDQLQARRKELTPHLKTSSIKWQDKQIDAEHAAQDLQDEINMLKIRFGLKP